MRLHALTVEDLRNFPSATLTPGAGLTVLIGPNGAGKTSLLEGVAFLAAGRSFRTARAATAVRHEQAAARLRARVSSDGMELALTGTIRAGNGSRSFTVDGAPTPLLRFVGRLRAIVFTPDDLQLVTAEPRHRRGFLDGILARSSATILEALLSLQRTVQQRNRLLLRIRQGLAGVGELDGWDDLFIRAARPVVEARVRLVHDVNARLPDLASILSGRPTPLAIEYAPSVVEESDAAWIDLLRSARSRDLALGVTTVGPHRESITVRVGRANLAEFGSRGEQRTAVLALKLAEFELARNATGEPPILLLDDVLSELDASHQDALLAATHDAQTLLTSTAVPATLPSHSSVTVIEVPSGVVPASA